MENIQDILKVEGVNAKGYGIIGKLAMQDKRITIEAKAIYSYFRSFAGAGTTAFPGVKRIIDDLGISENRYYRHFKLLKQYDYIRVDQITQGSGKFSRNVYTLVENPQEKPYIKQETVVEEPTLQNDGTVEEYPYLQNEGTGHKTLPSLHFPCTGNEGTNNNILLKLTDIYNNLSFYLNNVDNLNDDERELLKLILSDKNQLDKLKLVHSEEKITRKERRRDIDIESNKIKETVNEFREMVMQAQLEYCEDALAAEQALRLLYYSDKPLKINNIHIPPSQVREDLKRISIDIINAAFSDFYRQSVTQEIRNPVLYLSRCIYNAIWHSKIKLNAIMNYEGLNY